MKVALVLPGGVDRSGDRRVIPALMWLIRRLRNDVALRVFVLRQEPRRSSYRFEGVPVENIGFRLCRPRAVLALLRAHRRDPFDVFHAFWVGSPGAVAVIASRVVGRPAMVHVAGGELVDLPAIQYGGRQTARGRWLTDQVVGRAAVVTAASTPVVDAVRRFGRRAVRVPLGVGSEDWPARQPRERAGGSRLRLIHVASLNRVKDQETLLGAMGLLSKRGIDFHLDVVGGDTLGGLIQHRVHEIGLETRITFHGFMVQQSLRPLMEAADIAVMSSRHEAGPVVLGEAGAVGVPMVGTAVGQIADWAPDAAVAVPVGDAAALADAVAGLARDEPRRLAVARAAHARALDENADWTAARFRALYEQLAGSTHPSP